MSCSLFLDYARTTNIRNGSASGLVQLAKLRQLPRLSYSLASELIKAVKRIIPNICIAFSHAIKHLSKNLPHLRTILACSLQPHLRLYKDTRTIRCPWLCWVNNLQVKVSQKLDLLAYSHTYIKSPLPKTQKQKRDIPQQKPYSVP